MFICLLAACVPTLSAAESITGQVRVIDGDTFEFLETGTKVRIYGIDTLEKRQSCARGDTCVPCGEHTRQVAVALIGKSPVQCNLTGGGSYDRQIAICYVDGEDYARTMLRTGWALAYREYLPKRGKGAEYIGEEERAKAARVGIWGTQFIKPWDWRNQRMRLECERK